jgi:hypothetical protein
VILFVARLSAGTDKVICTHSNDQCRPVTSSELGGIISVFTAIPWFGGLAAVVYLAMASG